MSLPNLWHVTINTGDGRFSYRDEVSDEVVGIVRQHIQAALTKGTDAIPGKFGYKLGATAVASGLLATIMRRDIPVVTFAVTTRSRDIGRFWRLLHEGRPYLATHVGDVPRAPWCAVRIDRLRGLLEAREWLGRYERCVAWAWIESQSVKR